MPRGEKWKKIKGYKGLCIGGYKGARVVRNQIRLHHNGRYFYKSCNSECTSQSLEKQAIAFFKEIKKGDVKKSNRKARHHKNHLWALLFAEIDFFKKDAKRYGVDLFDHKMNLYKGFDSKFENMYRKKNDSACPFYDSLPEKIEPYKDNKDVVDDLQPRPKHLLIRKKFDILKNIPQQRQRSDIPWRTVGQTITVVGYEEKAEITQVFEHDEVELRLPDGQLIKICIPEPPS